MLQKTTKISKKTIGILFILLAATVCQAADYWLKYTGSLEVESYAAPNLSMLQPGLSDFSICFWVKQINTGQDETDYFYAYTSVKGVITIYAAQIGSHNATFVMAGAVADVVVNGMSIIDDGYHKLLTVTVDRDGLARLYVNGIEEGNASASSAVAVDYNNWESLKLNNPAGPTFDESYCDQARFYKGVVLTQEQILAIYNAGIGAKVVESEIVSIEGLSGFWYSEFDTGTGTTFSGRFWDVSSWTDSGGTLEGDVSWVSGGVPFIGRKKVMMRK